jgi:hypothetical protein
MVETAEPVVCSSTRKSVGKAGTVRQDMVEEGFLASLEKASAHLRGREMCLDVLLADACEEHDILQEVELRKLLTAFAVFAGTFSIC